MGFLDELSRKLAEGVDRARFEAEKFQRVTAIQGEISTLRRQIDGKRLEFGDRALELFKAGAIQSPTLAAILREIEALQASLTLKEEELRHVQGQVLPPAMGGTDGAGGRSGSTLIGTFCARVVVGSIKTCP